MSLRDDTIIAGGVNPEGKVVEVPSHQAINEKKIVTVGAGEEISEKLGLEADIQAAPPLYEVVGHIGHDGDGKDSDSENVIIVTGADAAAHLLPMRDDGEPALTFRSIVLATVLSAFQAVMNQIYTVCARGAHVPDSLVPCVLG
jgi:hypothetical protein